MRAFEDGERVRYVGVEGLCTQWTGREGVVTYSYRYYDGTQVEVRFDGEDRSVPFDEDDLEAVKTTYEIANSAEDMSWISIELTDSEAALVQRIVEGLNKDRPTYAPTMEMKKVEK